MGKDPAPRDRGARSETAFADESTAPLPVPPQGDGDPDATAPLRGLGEDERDEAEADVTVEDAGPPTVSQPSASPSTDTGHDVERLESERLESGVTSAEEPRGFLPSLPFLRRPGTSRSAPSGGSGAAPEVRYVRPHYFPRSVIGVVIVLLALAVGAAFSGTVLFSYYQSRLDRVERRVDQYIGRFEERYDQALKGITRERESAVADLRRELEPLEQLRAGGQGLSDLVKQLGDSVYLVETLDEFGQPRVGSAAVITADAEKSYLVTSLSVVRAATVKPGPAVNLRKGAETFPAVLWSWQDERDLALLIVDRPNLPRLKWLPSGAALGLGERVFSFAGLGGAGGSISQGFVLDVSAAGVQHDAAASGAFAGGPLVNSKGEMVGVVTPAYSPLGFTSDRVTFAPLSAAFCEKVLRCAPDAQSGSPGARR